MRKYILYTFFITIAFLEQTNAQESYTLNGYIRDQSTGEELIGATVYINELKTGMISNAYGFYSLTLPGGSFEVEYGYLGYDKKIIEIVLDKDITRDIELSATSTLLEEVVVTSEAGNKNIVSSEMGVVKLDPKRLQALPVIFGEQDILKSVQLMPGVKSSGEGNSGFFVRGGTIDQNLILLDEAPVYNASHLLGFFSVFNSDAIKNAKLIKGSMPAEYGGRISSVLDINMNEGNTKRFGVSGGVGLISSRLTVEGPVVKDRGAFILSARRSYADIFLKIAGDENQQKIDLYFYDLNAKANYRINRNNRIFISGYFGRDVFDFADRFGFEWGNATGTIRWNHLFSKRLFSNTSLIYSDYDYRFGNEAGDRRIDVSSGIRDVNIKQDFTFYLTPKNTTRFGFNALHHTFFPGELSTSDTSSINEIILEKRYAAEVSAYISNDWIMNDHIRINYGLRFSYFNMLGPGTVYQYDGEGNIIQEQVVADGESIKSYDNWEPRLSMNYIMNENQSIKASYSRNVQYLHLLSKSTSSTPSDLWLPSSNNLEPITADQVSLGYYRNLRNNLFKASAEIYYKAMDNLIDYKNGADLALNETVESQIITGIGRSYGVELSVEKTHGKMQGQVNYTFSRTERKFERVNDGTWFPAAQDRIHDISVTATFAMSEKWNIGANWVFTTGNPVTFPGGKYEYDGHIVNLYTERNGYRMPDYHRLDLSLTYTRKKTASRESSWSLSLYNVYARENAYAIYFRVNEDNPRYTEALKLSLFSIVPSITYNFKF